MRAAVYRAPGTISVEQVPDPVPAPGEVVLAVSACGVCGTDAHEVAHGQRWYRTDRADSAAGEGGHVPGHEPSGTVVAVGDGVTDLRVGDEVACGVNHPCGRCPTCAVGLDNICEHMVTIGGQRDGALAEYCAVPARTCRPLAPHGLTLDAGALAQPMAIAAHATGRGRVTAGDLVLVVGAGGIGSLVSWAAIAAGATVAVGDRRGERLDVVRRMGASAAVHASEAGSLPGLVADALDGGSCDVVFECTGSAEGLEAALGSVRRGGRIVLVGFHRVPRELALLPLTLDEVELVGTNSLSVARDLERGLQLLGARPDGWHDVAPAAIPLEGLVDDALLPLAEGRQRHIKVLVDPVARAPRATSN